MLLAGPNATMKNAIQDSRHAEAEQARRDELGLRGPSCRPNRPAIRKPSERQEDDEVVEHARLSPSAR